MNTTQTTLQIRIDQKTKKKAMETFEAMGLDISSGVKLFLNQVIKDEALPFRPAKDPKKIRAMWDKWRDDALKNGEGFTSVKALMDSLEVGI